MLMLLFTGFSDEISGLRGACAQRARTQQSNSFRLFGSSLLRADQTRRLLSRHVHVYSDFTRRSPVGDS